MPRLITDEVELCTAGPLPLQPGVRLPVLVNREAGCFQPARTLMRLRLAVAPRPAQSANRGLPSGALWPWRLPVHPKSDLAVLGAMAGAAVDSVATFPRSLPLVLPPRPAPRTVFSRLRTHPVVMRYQLVVAALVLIVGVWSLAGLRLRQPRGVQASAAGRPTAVASVAANTRQPKLAQAQGENPAAAASGGLLQSIRAALQGRAAILLHDDFRDGLGDWRGAAGWERSWSIDRAGFVRPGALALYQPSRGLSDYTFEFYGQIGLQGLGWVYRAQGLADYYATRLVPVRAGNQPVALLIRSTVVNGRETQRVKVTLPVSMQLDTVYEVRMEIRGDHYTTIIQDQLADFWTDSRYRSGGIGFFSSPGNQARLGPVTLTHQTDTLGRLCALLAPYQPQSN